MSREKMSGLFEIIFLIFVIVLCIALTVGTLDRAFEADRPHGVLVTIPPSPTVLPSPVVTITPVPTLMPHYITIIPTLAN